MKKAIGILMVIVFTIITARTACVYMRKVDYTDKMRSYFENGSGDVWYPDGHRLETLLAQDSEDDKAHLMYRKNWRSDWIVDITYETNSEMIEAAIEYDWNIHGKEAVGF